jgi:hypothetical protein
MSNYSMLGRKLREQIHEFSGKLSTHFSVPKQRCVEQVLYGLSATQDVKLWAIARSLEEDVPLIATEKRLSRNLAAKDMDKELITGVARMGSRRVLSDTLLVLDISDIAKPYGQKMEYLATVRDGSTGELAEGYWTCSIIGCEEGEQRIVPLYEKLYSAEAPKFKSENAEILSAVDAVRAATKERGVWVMDRGGDRHKLFRPFLDRAMRFIVRQRGKLHLVFRGRKRPTIDIALGCPMLYADRIVKETKDGEKGYSIQYVYRKVKLPGRNEQLYLVVVKGFRKRPLMLLTNLPMRKRRSVLWFTVGSYLTRWRIEDAIRFVKQSYNLEDIRVLKYQRVKNLIALVLAASYFVATYLGDRLKVAILARRVLKVAKRFFGIAFFRYYALADGVAAILVRATRGSLCAPRPPNQRTDQLELFEF